MIFIATSIKWMFKWRVGYYLQRPGPEIGNFSSEIGLGVTFWTTRQAQMHSSDI